LDQVLSTHVSAAGNLMLKLAVRWREDPLLRHMQADQIQSPVTVCDWCSCAQQVSICAGFISWQRQAQHTRDDVSSMFSHESCRD